MRRRGLRPSDHATLQQVQDTMRVAFVVDRPGTGARTTSMTVVSLLRISDKFRCDFPLGLSGQRHRCPTVWAKKALVTDYGLIHLANFARLKLDLN